MHQNAAVVDEIRFPRASHSLDIAAMFPYSAPHDISIPTMIELTKTELITILAAFNLSKCTKPELDLLDTKLASYSYPTTATFTSPHFRWSLTLIPFPPYHQA